MIKLQGSASVLVSWKELTLGRKMWRFHCKVRIDNGCAWSIIDSIDDVNVKNWKAFWVKHLHLFKSISVKFSAIEFSVSAAQRAGGCWKWLISDDHLLMSLLVFFRTCVDLYHCLFEVCCHLVKSAFEHVSLCVLQHFCFFHHYPSIVNLLSFDACNEKKKSNEFQTH